MSDIKLEARDDNLLITYADDIALLVGAARPPTAFKRIEKHLDKLNEWANKYSFEFSAQKIQLMSIKGGLKPTYQIRFGNKDEAPSIKANDTVKYLGVILDSRTSF